MTSPSVQQGSLLDADGISKAYGAVQALRDVSLQIRPGEVHAVVGENGSGKSTLVNILAGRIRADEGELQLGGHKVAFRSPAEATRRGIALVSQDLQLAPALSVAENVLLGRWPGRGGAVNWDAIYREAEAVLARLGAGIDVRGKAGPLGQDQRQLVEIGRALATEPSVLLLDEPTASLTMDQVESLFRVVRAIAAKDKAVVFVSHRLREVFELADRVSVLRDGRHVATLDREQATEEELVRLMVGRPLSTFFYKDEVSLGPAVLAVSGLTTDFVRDVSFEVRCGEIVGLAGLCGAGRTTVGRVLFGAEPRLSGSIFVDNKAIFPSSPADAMRAGLALIPEDRKQQGLLLESTVGENMLLAELRRRKLFGWLSAKRERALAEGFVRQLNIRTAGVNAPVRTLSGGNQQKVVLAKWLVTDPKVIILDEPTHGVDVGAKSEIYRIIGRLVQDGKAVLLISSELPELLALSDRVLAMYQGRIVAEFNRADASEERVARAILTGRP